MKNWKTSLSGLIATIGAAMQASDNATVKAVGMVVAGVGILFFGLSAKDNNVTGGTKQQ